VEKLPEVQDAKTLMLEAKNWSVMKWLVEKKRVRTAADRANAALDVFRQQIQKNWPDDLRAEYQALKTAASQTGARQIGTHGNAGNKVKQVWDADHEASLARELAEKTFDDAEKQLSTRLAREGCEKAVHSWELHEKAIDVAAPLARHKH
jgi:hypothetical protein